jgi:hypothetical protein
VEDAWERLVAVLDEEENDLNQDCEDWLEELGLEVDNEALEKVLDSVENIHEASPPDQNLQHFLHSLVHLKRVRQWLGREIDGKVEDDHSTRRELLRKMLVMRGNKETGYVGDWLNAVPCEALGTCS